MEFWLLTLTRNQVLRLAMLKMILRKKKGTTTTTRTTASLSRSQTTDCNKWWITNLGNTSRKQHNSSFCQSSKRCEKCEAPHINKDSSPLSVLMLFFTEIFHQLVQTIIYYQQHLDKQAGPSCRLPDIMLSDMTFVALALKLGHELKDTLQEYWSRLRYTLCFMARP